MKQGGQYAKAQQLISKGVRIPNPETITIGEEVSLEGIAGNGVVIHAGSRIFGATTVIDEGCEIGFEGPVTIESCQLGPSVKLKGGYFSGSTFLERAAVGSGAHIRSGCLLEEESNGAHTVGMKQTILLPFVTLGSLINFCDCLMAGGTSRKDHSEVGSSYIHFNYTPDQDKATPSLIGDVPRGVMLNQRPIFLGGQGGLVGPVNIGFGTVIAAGTIFRKDFPKGNGLLFSQISIKKHQPHYPLLYPGIKRIIKNNINYIANIIALRRWYLDVRSLFFGSTTFQKALYNGALEKLEIIIDERIQRLGKVAEKMPQSIEVYHGVMGEKASQKNIQLRREFFEQWARAEEFLRECSHRTGDRAKRDEFLELIQGAIRERGKDYLKVIKGMDHDGTALGTEWLQGVVAEINSEAAEIIPSLSA
ncbi:MAG: UDP-N-acetylglucosamine pyrophosphorylase [Deltaproteobacteria bacterium]|nr:UDP-N-acetylglucosamine pyrophosphorylase [Deltaproteobacteria bacterium]